MKSLGSLFSGTAGPLLPENIAFQSFNKMWRSPSSENMDVTTDLIGRKNSLRNAYDSFLPKIRRLSHQEPLTRKKSDDLKISRQSSDEESLNYEDNTDLESTITKLRQLLEERTSNDSIENGQKFFNFEIQIQSDDSIKIGYENEDQKSFKIGKKLVEIQEFSTILQANFDKVPILNCVS